MFVEFARCGRIIKRIIVDERTSVAAALRPQSQKNGRCAKQHSEETSAVESEEKQAVGRIRSSKHLSRVLGNAQLGFGGCALGGVDHQVERKCSETDLSIIQ